MKKILTICVIGIILLFLISFIFIPKKDFSEIENRSLESMPDFSFSNFIDGKYMEDIESYINDHFPLRNMFMNIRTVVNRFLGKQNIGDIYFGSDGYLLEYYDEISYSDDTVKVINKLYSSLDNVKYNVMFVPNKIYVYNDKLPKNVKISNQKQIINDMYKKLDKDINTIDICDSLVLEKDNYQLYYKTDHHWTMFGSYFGYKKFMNSNNMDYIDISLFDIEVISDSFLGTTYSKVVDPFSLEERMVLFNYKDYDLDVSYVIANKNTKSLYNFDYLEKKDKYAMFLDNNHPLIKITNNEIENNMNILIIKDSYANSMVPFLVNHYKNIHIVDPRYYKRSISKYISENNIDNVLILYNVGTLSTDSNILSIR